MASDRIFYRYKVPTFDILIPGQDPISIKPIHINSIFIEKDFEDDLFPILQVNLTLNYKQYRAVIQNKATVKFKIKLEKYVYEEKNAIDQIKYPETVLDSLFGAYISDDTPFLDKQLYTSVTEDLKTTENEMLETYEFFLFKENDITASKKIYNRVISQASLTDVLTYMFATSGTTKVLMSPLDNTKQYPEILLPPLPLWQNVSYLEEQYGLYKHGALHFYDFNKMYFIDRGPECTAWEPDEITDVIITCTKHIDNDPASSGMLVDRENRLYRLFLHIGSVKMMSYSIQNEPIRPSNINVINTKNGSVTEIKPEVSKRLGSMQYVVNNYSNEYMHSMIEYNKFQNEHVVQAPMKDIDIDCLSPNKRFRITFDDKEIDAAHGGYYRMTTMMSVFNRVSDTEFAVSSSVEFKKSR